MRSAPSSVRPSEGVLEKIYPLHNSAVGWEELDFRPYHIILVTGPQRSGTTWVACTLATDLGYELYDERHPITGGNDTLTSLKRALGYLLTQVALNLHAC
ncbi:MAG: hypothetical protein SGPRY_000057 [Prymnesium sp.]